MSVRIAVFGLGYLGATHALCMAELGHDVVGVDVDAAKVAMLQSGQLPFYEPGLGDVLERNLAAGRLRFTTSYADAAQFARVHFLAVGTPQLPGSLAADLSHVDAVIDSLAPLLSRRWCSVSPRCRSERRNALLSGSVIWLRRPRGWNSPGIRSFSARVSRCRTP